MDSVDARMWTVVVVAAVEDTRDPMRMHWKRVKSVMMVKGNLPASHPIWNGSGHLVLRMDSNGAHRNREEDGRMKGKVDEVVGGDSDGFVEDTRAEVKMTAVEAAKAFDELAGDCPPFWPCSDCPPGSKRRPMNWHVDDWSLLWTAEKGRLVAWATGDDSAPGRGHLPART